MKKKNRLIRFLALCGVLLMLPAAMIHARGDISIGQGTMLHAQQALERYGVQGEPILQYLELWMDASRRLQREVGEDGQALSGAFSGDQEYLAWEADTLKAVRLEGSKVFLPDYTRLKDDFDKVTPVSGQTYAKRACTAILLEDSGHEEDWLKIYLDDETGFVLFCEAPLFRLRTSLLEVLPAEDRLLMPPVGLIF